MSKHSLSTCKGCLLGKSTHRTFKPSKNQCLKLFELIHMDLAGPMQTKSLQGNHFHYILVDDSTGFKWAFFLKKKNQVFECFKTYVAFISTQFNVTLRTVWLDCGREFISIEFLDFMKSKNILHQFTAPNTP